MLDLFAGLQNPRHLANLVGARIHDSRSKSHQIRGGNPHRSRMDDYRSEQTEEANRESTAQCVLEKFLKKVLRACSEYGSAKCVSAKIGRSVTTKEIEEFRT